MRKEGKKEERILNTEMVKKQTKKKTQGTDVFGNSWIW